MLVVLFFICYLCVQIRPGLGLDEKFYAWTVSVYGIGELLFALVFAVAVKVVRVKLVTLFGLLCVIVGSVVYGLASAGWMVIVGRFLQGAFLGGQSTLMRIYLGETSNVAIGIKGEDPRRSQIKNINFLISFGVGTTAIAIGPGTPTHNKVSAVFVFVATTASHFDIIIPNANFAAKCVSSVLEYIWYGIRLTSVI